MGLDQILGLCGLFLGALGGGFGWWYGRRQAARNRGLDERYEIISGKSLANAWKITLVSFYLLFILVIFKVHISAAAVLGILLIVHMAGWAISTIYYNVKL